MVTASRWPDPITSSITPVNRFMSARMRCRWGIVRCLIEKNITPLAMNAVPIANGSQLPSPTMNAASPSITGARPQLFNAVSTASIIFLASPNNIRVLSL